MVFMSINKVLILLSQPLNSHVEKKLNIRGMLKGNLDVEVLDLSSFMMPDYPSVNFALKDERFSIIKIASKRDLISYLKERSRSVVAIDMSNPTPWIRSVLNKYHIKSIRLLTGGLPIAGPSSYENRVTTRIAVRKIFRLLTTTSISHLLTKVSKELYRKLYVFIKKPYLDVIILGGRQLLGNEFSYICNKTRIIESHVHDYEVYVEAQYGALKANNDYLVFVDQNIPYHPDFTLKGVRYSSPSKYYAGLRRLFTCLENGGVDVIIALHPRDDNTNTADRFGDRVAIKGDTLSLISQSGGIITHCSNAINYAILLQKPVLFVADKELLGISAHINILSDWFGKCPVMLDRHLDFENIWASMCGDIENRRRYQDDFICCPGDSGRSITDILITEIRGQ